MANSRDTIHPTRAALIESVVRFLETKNPENLTVDEVLKDSGISTGSLYQHFVDFPDLINQAMVARYADEVAKNIETLSLYVGAARDAKTLFDGIRTMTTATVGPDYDRQRYVRAQTMTRASTNEQFRAALLPHQERLTNALADIVRNLQSRNLFHSDLNPVAVSIFIQAYSLGLMINDVSGHPTDHASTVDIVVRVLERSFVSDSPSD